MKSFLLNSQNKPVIKWGSLPNNIFFEGTVPKGYFLAVCPSENIVILDVDVKNEKNGFNHIPKLIFKELFHTFFYDTPSGGRHYWIRYTGNKVLKNCATEFGLDLRVGANGKNAGGYVKYHYKQDIRSCIYLIKPSSKQLNKWLEKLFN